MASFHWPHGLANGQHCEQLHSHLLVLSIIKTLPYTCPLSNRHNKVMYSVSTIGRGLANHKRTM